MLKLYNTLTQKKEDFIPKDQKTVGLYVCGVTVYDYCHLGHARAYVCFDILYRYLREQGYAVNYVRNVTDIDDKIIQRAKEANMSCDDLAQKYTVAMQEDFEALSLLKPSHEPRATDYIESMIALIVHLEKKQIAYRADNGDVYYDIARFPQYGQLSHKDLAGLEAGARVAADDAKRHPLDFVLWKAEKPGEPSWPSPWGNGRPGWHIECSAMATDLLGQQFDIHGGGADLQFPHHENELAQSEAAFDCQYVNYWLHVGYLQINDEKMSKSLNNFFTIRDVLKSHHPEVVRYFLLSSHYRSQLNYSEANLHQAHASLKRFYNSLCGVDYDEATPLLEDSRVAFFEAMDDDLNTPKALSVLFDLANHLNQAKQTGSERAAILAKTLLTLGGVLGLLQQSPDQFLQGDCDAAFVDKIEKLIADRDLARKQKDWQSADKIRDDLLAMHIEILDSPEKTTWRRLSD